MQNILIATDFRYLHVTEGDTLYEFITYFNHLNKGKVYDSNILNKHFFFIF